MSNAVMPLTDYVAACDAVREKTGSAEAIKSGEMAVKINDVFKAGQLDIISRAEALKGSASGTDIIAIADVSHIEHNVKCWVSSDTVTDLSAVTVKRYGKNLVNSTDFDVNRSITITLDNPLPAGTYTISGLFTTTATQGLVQFVYASGGTTSGNLDVGYDNNPNKRAVATRTFSKPIAKINIYAGFGYTASAGHTASVADFMIEKGSTATDYEPYIEPTEHTANADGMVEGIRSLYPTTTLSSDTQGVIITAEYIKDIDKAFEERLAALEAELVNNQ